MARSRVRRIGVLALQGSFVEHAAALERLGAEAVPVRLPDSNPAGSSNPAGLSLETLDGLILPGGESTAMARMMDRWGLREPLARAIRLGLPVYGTCAGLVLLAGKLEGPGPETLGVMDITVRRNAFGRQLESFEQDLEIDGLEGGLFRAVFIRAPLVETAGEGVRVLARLEDGRIVAGRQGSVLVTAFHPELTDDLRMHALFLSMAEGYRRGRI